MKLLKAKQSIPKKINLEISKIHFIKSMTPLPELLEGEELQTPRKGVNGATYKEKEYSVFKGSQRVQAAIQLGYTHIEGIIING